MNSSKCRRPRTISQTRRGGSRTLCAPRPAVQTALDRSMAPTEPPVRWGLVNEVKAAIAAGTYDNPDRWDAALDALADRLL